MGNFYWTYSFIQSYRYQIVEPAVVLLFVADDLAETRQGIKGCSYENETFPSTLHKFKIWSDRWRLDLSDWANRSIIPNLTSSADLLISSQE